MTSIPCRHEDCVVNRPCKMEEVDVTPAGQIRTKGENVAGEIKPSILVSNKSYDGAIQVSIFAGDETDANTHIFLTPQQWQAIVDHIGIAPFPTTVEEDQDAEQGYADYHMIPDGAIDPVDVILDDAEQDEEQAALDRLDAKWNAPYRNTEQYPLHNIFGR